MRAETEVKLQVSYFNNLLDAWEPVLEKSVVKLTVKQDTFSTHILCQSKTPVNINLTEELFDTLSTSISQEEQVPQKRAPLHTSQHSELEAS